MEVRKISRRRPRSVDDAEVGHFTFLGTLRNRTAVRLRTAERRKRISRKTGNAQSRATFFRHSAVLSPTAVLLRKLPLDLQRTATKCTKIYNARAQLLFCSLNLLFSDVLVAVIVVVCLSSLLFCSLRHFV